MKEYLISTCGGNHRGYEGAKEEIDAMFTQCFKDAKEMGVTDSTLEYNYKNRDKMKPNSEGKYVVTYWSKW